MPQAAAIPIPTRPRRLSDTFAPAHPANFTPSSLDGPPATIPATAPTTPPRTALLALRPPPPSPPPPIPPPPFRTLSLPCPPAQKRPYFGPAPRSCHCCHPHLPATTLSLEFTREHAALLHTLDLIRAELQRRFDAVSLRVSRALVRIVVVVASFMKHARALAGAFHTAVSRFRGRWAHHPALSPPSTPSSSSSSMGRNELLGYFNRAAPSHAVGRIVGMKECCDAWRDCAQAFARFERVGADVVGADGFVREVLRRLEEVGVVVGRYVHPRALHSTDVEEGAEWEGEGEGQGQGRWGSGRNRVPALVRVLGEGGEETRDFVVRRWTVYQMGRREIA